MDPSVCSSRVQLINGGHALVSGISGIEHPRLHRASLSLASREIASRGSINTPEKCLPRRAWTRGRSYVTAIEKSHVKRAATDAAGLPARARDADQKIQYMDRVQVD
jgi:hypothetical protein